MPKPATLRAIETATSLDTLEVLRRAIVVELDTLLSLERLCYARAIVLGAEVSTEGWLVGAPIVGDSA